MNYKWTLQSKAPEEFSGLFDKKERILADILWRRNVQTKEGVEQILHPDYERDLYDPFLMKGVRQAIERIKRAVANDEKILIFGDFDADGISATVILHEFFLQIGFKNFEVYMPGRIYEGRDLTPDQIKNFKKQDIQLLITFDTGIDANDAVEEANSQGIDVIIVDHHIVPETLPNAVSVIDPKQKGDTYPFKFLCGAGLAFKLVQALLLEPDPSWNINPGWEKWLLDVVAISTVADMVPILDENRTLVYWGMKVLRKTRRLGLRELYKVSKIDSRFIDTDTISFELAPRINAASRMDHANSSFLLLTTSSQSEAKSFAELINEKNIERKEMVNDIVSFLEREVVEQQKDDPLIFAGDFSWSTVGLGVAANRILDKTYKPIFLWGLLSDNVIKGSARSIGVDVRDALKQCGDLFISFGGHKQAAGFSLEKSKIKDVQQCIVKVMQTKVKEIPPQELFIDGELDIKDVNWDFHKMISRLEPFGMEFSKPLFVFKNVEIEHTKEMGKNGGHWRMVFVSEHGEKVNGILFFANPKQSECVKDETNADVVANLEHSRFRGRDELRLHIVDIRKHGEE